MTNPFNDDYRDAAFWLAGYFGVHDRSRSPREWVEHALEETRAIYKRGAAADKPNPLPTPSPPIAYNGHHYCSCGIPEPVRVCTCDRPLNGPLEEGSCTRCRFWLRHKKGDHRRWTDIPEEVAIYENILKAD